MKSIELDFSQNGVGMSLKKATTAGTLIYRPSWKQTREKK
ncbi:MAG: hypothetical protein Ct9H300mP11_27820 [Chloroflexota bacterium]|nr:MAG: hypothetical protein Ct9H300mP11_27820 [Chloroflexota bacterium]